MRFRSLVGALLLALLWPAGALRADEPVLEFLAGLRAREYYDTALQYLDHLEQRSDLKPEVRQALPYERAVTLSAEAKEQRNPESQEKQLETARTLLTQFLAAATRHPLAAEANSELGQLQLTQGRLLAKQARGLPGAAERSAKQVQAQGAFEKARVPLEAALKLHKARYDAFPKQIDKVSQKNEYAAREQALSAFIKAQFDLGYCTFEEAHAHDAASPTAKALLSRAAEEFDKIYQQFRTNGAGIYALLFQGQCFQEQGELGKALGIFDQILKLQEETGRLRPLQDQARHLRLVCLGDQKSPDLKGVKAEAEEWLKSATPASKRSPSGLGIQWELVQALDKLAKEKETTAVEKDLYLKQALATAQFIHQYASEYKGPSTQIIGRLSTALKIKKPGAPRDFDAAYAAAMQMGEELDKRMRGLETGTPEEKAMQEEALKLHLGEMANALRLSMSLFTRKDSTIDLNNARMQLAKIYFRMKDHSYDAALMAEHIAKHYKSVDDKVAQEAAELAMAAYYQGYYAAPEAQQKVDLEQLRSLGNQITLLWPNSDLSNKSLMNLGQLYAQIQEPAKAADFYNRIPPEAASYLEAQLLRGLAYWQQYAAESVILPLEKRPAKAELEKLRDQAEQILDQSVKKSEAKLTKGQSASYPVNSAKLSLVQILNNSGKYQKAIDLLTAGERPLTKEVAVENPKARPERGTTSQDFAFKTYNELLRSYVGVQDVEKAQGALKQLETLEAGNPQGLNSLLQNLGKALQGEVQRLQQAHDPRVAEVTASFEKFLAELLQRKEAQEFSMLLWIAETYTALGNGVKEGGGIQEKSKELFGKAAEANKAILKLAASDPKAIRAEYIPTIRLRLVSNLRRQQAFEPALEEVRKFLKDNKQQVFDAQIEAARIYTDWGLNGNTKNAEKWQIAVKGDRKDGIWGWEAITNRLLALRKSKPGPEIDKSFLEARYNVALGFYHYGLQQAKSEAKQMFLERSRQEIMATAILTTLDKNDPDVKRYDTLYRDIQTQANTLSGSKAAIVGLDAAFKPGATKDDPEAEEKPADATADAGDKSKKADKKANDDAKAARKNVARKGSDEKTEHKGGGTSWLTVVVLVLIAVGACGYIGFMAWSSAKKSRKPARRRTESDEPVAAKKATTRKRRPLPASPPEEAE